MDIKKLSPTKSGLILIFSITFLVSDKVKIEIYFRNSVSYEILENM